MVTLTLLPSSGATLGFHMRWGAYLALVPGRGLLYAHTMPDQSELLSTIPLFASLPQEGPPLAGAERQRHDL